MAKKGRLLLHVRDVMVSLILLVVAFVLSVAVLSYKPFVVQNAGHKPIQVLGVGVGPKGFVSLWSPSGRESWRTIAPGDRDTIRYSFDSTRLCGLLVKVDGEKPRVLRTPSTQADTYCPVIDPNTEERFCCMPFIGWGDVLVAPPTSQLELAPKSLFVLASLRDYLPQAPPE